MTKIGCTTRVDKSTRDSIFQPRAFPLLGGSISGNPPTQAQYDSLSADFGAEPNIVVFFKGFSQPQNAATEAFPRGGFDLCKANNAVPLLTLEAFYFASPSPTWITLEEYQSGVYQPYIESLADAIIEFGDVVLLRVNHEANLRRIDANSYSWAEASFADNDANTPARVVQLYNLICGDIRAALAAKGHDPKYAQFVWCVNNENSSDIAGASAWNTIQAYAPDPQYVNIVSLDGYNFVNIFGFRSLQDIVEVTATHASSNAYDIINNLFPGRPFLIAETNYKNEDDLDSVTPTLWRDWAVDGWNYAIAKKIFAVCYFKAVDKNQLIKSDFTTDPSVEVRPNCETTLLGPVVIKTKCF